ncbi:hypothetical protein M5K25_012161 [Dendrobium thyrsiflorum]|uniref:Uncharacterized protein n=1 Tax=Dendrobium thyrsiflorum TaxID=117978 RepID=A0ABD0UWW9_DENTH
MERLQLTTPDRTLVPCLPPSKLSEFGYFSGDFDPRLLPYLGGITSGGSPTSPLLFLATKMSDGPKRSLSEFQVLFVSAIVVIKVKVVVSSAHAGFRTTPDRTLVPCLPPSKLSEFGYFSGDFDPRLLPYLGGITSGGSPTSPLLFLATKMSDGPKVKTSPC